MHRDVPFGKVYVAYMQLALVPSVGDAFGSEPLCRDGNSSRRIALEIYPMCTHIVGPYRALQEGAEAYVGSKLLHAEQFAHLYVPHLNPQGKQQVYLPDAYFRPRPLGEPCCAPSPGGLLYGREVQHE